MRELLTSQSAVWIGCGVGLGLLLYPLGLDLRRMVMWRDRRGQRWTDLPVMRAPRANRWDPTKLRISRP